MAAVSARIRFAVALVLVVAVSSSGCWTFLHIDREFMTSSGPPPEFYGGVRFEYHCITTPGEPPFDMRFVFLPFLLIDLPLSAVGDTVTLPWVAVRQVIAATTENASETSESRP